MKWPSREEAIVRGPRSILIPLTCVVHVLVAAVGLYISALGWFGRPEPLQRIDETGKHSVRLEQARQTLEQALAQEPANRILSEFYSTLFLELEYEDLAEFTKPLFEGDSFERRLIAYNSTIVAVDPVYRDAVLGLGLLSVVSLVLVSLMLWKPSYFVSALLASCPIAVAFTCALLGINFDPVFQFWAPFLILGSIVFVLQLIFAFRFGRPEHRTVEGLPLLMVYRRGLLMVNLGLFFLITAMLMATGSLGGEVRSLRASIGLWLFGEGGIVAIGLVLSLVLIILGVREMNRKPRGQVDSTSS